MRKCVTRDSAREGKRRRRVEVSIPHYAFTHCLFLRFPRYLSSEKRKPLLIDGSLRIYAFVPHISFTLGNTSSSNDLLVQRQRAGCGPLPLVPMSKPRPSIFFRCLSRVTLLGKTPASNV